MFHNAAPTFTPLTTATLMRFSAVDPNSTCTDFLYSMIFMTIVNLWQISEPLLINDSSFITIVKIGSVRL